MVGPVRHKSSCVHVGCTWTMQWSGLLPPSLTLGRGGGGQDGGRLQQRRQQQPRQPARQPPAPPVARPPCLRLLLSVKRQARMTDGQPQVSSDTWSSLLPRTLSTRSSRRPLKALTVDRGSKLDTQRPGDRLCCCFPPSPTCCCLPALGEGVRRASPPPKSCCLSDRQSMGMTRPSLSAMLSSTRCSRSMRSRCFLSSSRSSSRHSERMPHTQQDACRVRPELLQPLVS